MITTTNGNGPLDSSEQPILMPRVWRLSTCMVKIPLWLSVERVKIWHYLHVRLRFIAILIPPPTHLRLRQNPQCEAAG